MSNNVFMNLINSIALEQPQSRLEVGRGSLTISLLLCSFLVSLTACEAPCVLNSQCSSDERCVEGSCLSACTAYYQCAEGEACVEGACQVPPRGYCETERRRGGDGGPSVACEPPDFDFTDMTSDRADADLDEGVMVSPKDVGVEQDLGDMEMSLAGEMAGATAGEMAGATAGDVAGMMAGELAGQPAGEVAGEGAGESAGESAGMGAGSEMGGSAVGDMGVAGEMLSPDMGRPISTSPWLYTSGPTIYQTGAVQWIGRGVNLHDTRSCDTCTWIAPDVDEVLRRVDEVVDLWGANLLRLNLESYPVASGRIQYRPLLEDRAYLADIERIVHHIGQKRGTYVILNLWREPSLSNEGYPTSQTHTLLRELVRRFYDAPQVIFSVSPGVRQNAEGMQDSVAWETMNNAVNAIREEEQTLSAYRHLIAVPGLRSQGRDLSHYIEHPITAGGGINIVYDAQIFAAQTRFDSLLVSPAQTLPVIVSAFGPSQASQREMSQADAMALIQEAERLNVSWAAWTFHMRCVSSPMLVDQTDNGCGIDMPLQPTEWGLAIQGQLGLH